MTEMRGREPLTESLTRRVADLARLELTDEEVKTFTHQIADVLKYVDQLQSLDVSQVEPLTHPFDESGALREDKVVVFKSEATDFNTAIRNGFEVPKVL